MAATATGGWRRWIGLGWRGRASGRCSTQAKYAVVQTTCPGSSGLISLVVGAAAAGPRRRGRRHIMACLGLGRGEGRSEWPIPVRAQCAAPRCSSRVSILLQGAAGFVFSDCHR